ncbi:3-hydroxyacyl-CoA dehydrogenase [Fictibacillus barbaricus]|uniref:3-hydroxyacyl-CoA dehydrogenase n=1 Tax=Fictibacillus barbaricus TaxID=182136 RepID=A0ABS2ZEQ3_9BACL|nr:3-hydroxyacyl-CoA dehydrogenase [Fictibacillus barbaricus]MBN3545081.1 3-hydroxyacyl-CoA dehydrogenase [Fictibacillus barbaricus]GGB61897.1 3-hydroxybutyryl-CoA dehydrogenase [Fictibacillus barbaricus]
MSVNHILVVGSGVMGRGIAYSAALGGYQVTLSDISPSAIENAQNEIEQLFAKDVERGRILSKEAKDASSRLTYSTALQNSAALADFVIEAVPEVMSIKKDIFEKLDQYTPSHTILATNTSTMSPTEIGSYTKRSDRTIAMHFFNPVHKMRLVEIIRGLETSDETLRITQEVAYQMGKETVGVNEFPGFVTSRISSLVGNEAFNMLMEGVGTAEEIDKAIELGLNYPMGPFKLGDMVGLDTRLKNLEYLHKTLGEKYRPSPLLVKYVKSGRLGRKTGKGVYNYT